MNRSKLSAALFILADALILIILSWFLKPNYLYCIGILMLSEIPWWLLHFYFREGRKRAFAKVGFWVIFCAGVITLLGCYGRNYFLGSQTAQDTPDLEETYLKYKPFSDSSSLARIEEEPEISLSGELPVLNGTADFFPLYSAIVNMVYPDTIGELNTEGSPYRYSTSAGAFMELLDGTCDVVFSAMPDDEIFQTAEEMGLKLKLYPIAEDAFVFLANSENPVTDLTADRIRSIYSGDISNWQTLGGNDVGILVYEGADNSRIRDTLESFMGDTPLMIPQSELNVENGEIRVTASSYVNSEGAIGCTFYSLTHAIEDDKGVHFLKVDGIYPDRETVFSGGYGLKDTVYCITVEGRETYNTGVLINWILSAQGKRLLNAAGFITQ